jgi:2'-5' RNA ligase
MRLFIAVNFPDETKSRILMIQDQLRSQALRGNFTRPENLHLTLVFLGETPEEKLPAVFRVTRTAEFPPFEISFNRAGCFTRGRKELWWIGADQNSPGLSRLEAIHKRLLGGLSEAGLPADKRPFNAHITLGREIKRFLPILLDTPDITVMAGRISLMKSENIRGALTYTELY